MYCTDFILPQTTQIVEWIAGETLFLQLIFEMDKTYLNNIGCMHWLAHALTYFWWASKYLRITRSLSKGLQLQWRKEIALIVQNSVYQFCHKLDRSGMHFMTFGQFWGCGQAISRLAALFYSQSHWNIAKEVCISGHQVHTVHGSYGAHSLHSANGSQVQFQTRWSDCTDFRPTAIQTYRIAGNIGGH